MKSTVIFIPLLLKGLVRPQQFCDWGSEMSSQLGGILLIPVEHRTKDVQKVFKSLTKDVVVCLILFCKEVFLLKKRSLS